MSPVRSELKLPLGRASSVLPLLLCLACGGRAHDVSPSSGSAGSGNVPSTTDAAGSNSEAGAAGDHSVGGYGGTSGTPGDSVAGRGSDVAAGGSALAPWGDSQADCDGFAKAWTTSSCSSCIEDQAVLCESLSSFLFTDCSTSFNCADTHCLSCQEASCQEEMCGCLADCQVVNQSAACRDAWVKFMKCYAPCSDSCQ